MWILRDPTTGNLADPATLASSSLIAANISTQKSTDRGQTYARNNLGNVPGGLPADDRQWEEFLGNNTVYLFYRTLAPAVSQIQRSDDGGLTFGPATTAGAIGQAGYIDVHQKTGTVYVSGSTGQVCHSTVTLPTGEAAVYQCVQAASDPNGVAHLFFVVKVADDGTPNGTVYVAYSNDHDIFLVHSTDKGVTWSAPVRVSMRSLGAVEAILFRDPDGYLVEAIEAPPPADAGPGNVIGSMMALTVADLFRMPEGTGSMREALGRPTGTNTREDIPTHPAAPRPGLPTPTGAVRAEDRR